jgi:RNA polymerase sigma factor (sigma-70 family)
MDIRRDSFRESELNLHEITTGMSCGDAVAFNSFFDAYYPRLYRYLFVVAGGNEALAKDCIQDAMLRIIRHVKPCDNEPAFWGWLTRVVKSVFIDEMRKRKRRQMFVLPEDFWRGAESSDDGLIAALDAAITELSEDEQTLLKGYYFEKKNHQLLANEKDITAKAVESRLARTRKKLKALLSRSVCHAEE